MIKNIAKTFLKHVGRKLLEGVIDGAVDSLGIAIKEIDDTNQVRYVCDNDNIKYYLTDAAKNV